MKYLLASYASVKLGDCMGCVPNLHESVFASDVMVAGLAAAIGAVAFVLKHNERKVVLA